MKEGKNNSRRPEKLEIWLFSMKSSQTSSFQVKILEQKGHNIGSRNSMVFTETTRQRKQYLIPPG